MVSIELAQAFIDVLAFFLPTFAVMLAVSWVVSFFRKG